MKSRRIRWRCRKKSPRGESMGMHRVAGLVPAQMEGVRSAAHRPQGAPRRTRRWPIDGPRRRGPRGLGIAAGSQDGAGWGRRGACSLSGPECWGPQGTAAKRDAGDEESVHLYERVVRSNGPTAGLSDGCPLPARRVYKLMHSPCPPFLRQPPRRHSWLRCRPPRASPRLARASSRPARRRGCGRTSVPAVAPALRLAGT